MRHTAKGMFCAKSNGRRLLRSTLHATPKKEREYKILNGTIDIRMFEGFLEKTVLVKAGGYRILGILKAVERSPIDRHPPLILVLENHGNLAIIRGCFLIVTRENVKRSRRKFGQE